MILGHVRNIRQSRQGTNDINWSVIIKGTPKRTSITGLIDGNGMIQYTHSIFSLDFWSSWVNKSPFKRLKNTTVSTAAVCISDSVSKAELCSKSIKYIMGQPLSALHCQRVNQNGYLLGSSNQFEGKKCSFSFIFFFL